METRNCKVWAGTCSAMLLDFRVCTEDWQERDQNPESSVNSARDSAFSHSKEKPTKGFRQGSNTMRLVF